MTKCILIISVFIIFFTSCENFELVERNHDVDYFPNSEGTFWIYERYDSLTSSIDTITVTIIGDTVLSNQVYKIWNYKYVDKNKTFYVLIKNDSVIIYNSRIDRIDQLYLIPFNPGTGWINPDYHFDTSFVSTVQDIKINQRVYEDAVLIERNAFCCNDYLMEKIYMEPGIGLIKLERWHYVFGPLNNESWKLIDKNIKY